jgi:selT/selW/selH-like putative selenoprotein
LIASSGGVFEVSKDGVTIFSKKKLGRFPEHTEILDLLNP